MNPKQLITIARDTYNLNNNGHTYEDGKISYVNWWKNDLEKQWFTDFIENSPIKTDKKIRFYSVFGSYKALNDNFDGIKVFYTGENLMPRVKHQNLLERPEKTFSLDRRAALYRNNISKLGMNLCLTFSTDGIDNAIRFPYWILTHFSNCHSIEDVKERLDKIEAKYKEADTSRQGAVVVASHDFFGTRTNICDALESCLDITYAGKWRNNSEALWTTYNNDKGKLLRKYRFNICPENMDAKEYVTEKIWDSFANGCIPIYSGALGNPEPNIFIKKAFILWPLDDVNPSNVEEIQRLARDDEYYHIFKNKPLFVKGSAEYIWNIIMAFEKAINEL